MKSLGKKEPRKAGDSQTQKARLRELEEDYCKAANALRLYQRENGFVPGARVEAQFQKEATKLGVIAPYGEYWSTVHHLFVPVILDEGRVQPWTVSDLTIVAK